MFEVIMALLGLGMLPMVGAVEDPPEDPPQDPPKDPPEDPPSEPTAEQIYEQWKKGDLLTKDRNNEIVQDRLARERKNRETEAEKEKQQAQADALKENEEYKKLYEQTEESKKGLEAERDKAIDSLNSERVQNSLKGALRDAGINAERLPLALRVADTSEEYKEVSIADDGKVSGVDKVVEAVKKDSPEWFEAKQESPGGSPPSPRPARRERTAEDDAEAKDRARRQTRASF